MRILVVHDREDAREEVCAVCRETVPGATVEIATDYVTARQQLTSSLFDIAVVDLTLPHRSGGAPSYEKAADLLREVLELDDINAPGDVIGITHDAGALSMISVDIGQHLMAVIPETGNTDWRKLLADRLRYVGRARHARARSISQHFETDVCILTALDKERAPYRELFELRPEPAVSGAERFDFVDRLGEDRSAVVLSIGRAGQPRAAAQAQILLSVFRPKFLLMSGICGGVKGKAKFGDIVFFESVIDWDYGKWKTPKNKVATFHSRPDPLSMRDQPCHQSLRKFISEGGPDIAEIHQRVRAAYPFVKRAPEVLMGPCASGSAVIGNQEIIGRIANLNDSIVGVDMEAYGLYAARSVTNVVRPQALCVKAVSDHCDGSKTDRWHLPSSLISAEVVKSLMTSWLDFH